MPKDTLWNAANEGRIDDVKKFLNDGTFDIHATNSDGWTALHEACKNGHCDIAELLLEIEGRSTSGDDATPLMYACCWYHLSVIQLLLDRKCVMDATDVDGCTALHYACCGFHSSTACVKELLDHGADIHFPDFEGETPMDHANEPEMWLS